MISSDRLPSPRPPSTVARHTRTRPRRLQARAEDADWDAREATGAAEEQKLLRLRPEPEPGLQPAWQPPLWSVPTPPGFLQQLQQLEAEGGAAGALPPILAPAKIEWPAHMRR